MSKVVRLSDTVLKQIEEFKRLYILCEQEEYLLKHDDLTGFSSPIVDMYGDDSLEWLLLAVCTANSYSSSALKDYQKIDKEMFRKNCL